MTGEYSLDRHQSVSSDVCRVLTAVDTNGRYFRRTEDLDMIQVRQCLKHERTQLQFRLNGLS